MTGQTNERPHEPNGRARVVVWPRSEGGTQVPHFPFMPGSSQEEELEREHFLKPTPTSNTKLIFFIDTCGCGYRFKQSLESRRFQAFSWTHTYGTWEERKNTFLQPISFGSAHLPSPPVPDPRTTLTAGVPSPLVYPAETTPRRYMEIVPTRPRGDQDPFAGISGGGA